jgi:3-deoxy-manno-octulosonate cytidylyltransferase (CMP-KDO synthetase)
LLEVTRLPVSTYERAEALEQLRWLESGRQIFVGVTAGETLGIDTPADLERARSFLENEEV